jgi:hypothetical protein
LTVDRLSATSPGGVPGIAADPLTIVDLLQVLARAGFAVAS